MSQERSADWLRGAVHVATQCGQGKIAGQYQMLLAEAEAREGSLPTVADLAVADELDMLAAHIQEYIGPDDARDDIRRICRNRAADLRLGVKRGPLAAEVIAAAERELRGGLEDFDGCEINPANYNDDNVSNLNAGYVGLFQTIENTLAAIAKWKEAQRLLEGQ